MVSTTQPRILVKAGSSLTSLSTLHVNADAHPLAIRGQHFEGNIVVRMASYLGPTGAEGLRNPESDYFEKREGGMTWSIGIEGRFLGDFCADDIVFGNVWEKPIRDHLPYGTSAGLTFIHFLDPALVEDVYADKPHAESPLIATMNFVNVVNLPANSPLPHWNPSPIIEDATPLFAAGQHEELRDNAATRKKVFADAGNRKATKLTSNHVISADFCNPYLNFETLSLKLPIGLSFPLKSSWDGQPITFICRSRDHSKTFFVLTFDIVEDEKSQVVAPPVVEQEENKVVEEDDLGVD